MKFLNHIKHIFLFLLTFLIGVQTADAGLFNFRIEATAISELQGLLNTTLRADENISIAISDAYNNEESLRTNGTEGTPPHIKVYLTKEGLRAELTKEYLSQLGDYAPSILDRLNNILNDILDKAELNLQDCNKSPIECAKNKLNLLQVINLNITSLAKEGVFDKSMWDKTGSVYKIIPKEYGDWHPVVGGAADGVVEEVTDLPVLLLTAGEVIIDKQQREAIKKIFTKEGISKLGEAMAHNIVVTMTDDDKRAHAITKGSVQALFLWYALANAAGKSLKELLDNATDLVNKLDNAPLLQKRVNDLIAIKDKGKIKQLNKLLDEVDPKKLERLIGKVEAKKVDVLLDDIAGNKALRDALLDSDGLGLVDSWKIISHKPKVRIKVEALESLTTLRNNAKLTSKLPGKTQAQIDDILGKMKSWGSGSTGVSYKQVCDKVNELIDELPSNVTGLEKYLGSQGFGNGLNYTNRHSWVQLERLLANKQKLKIADEIIFENPISFNGFNSVTDVYLRIGSDIFEIETKAGIKFFENVANSSSNFAKQSFNSLNNVNKLENYKVFLNPTILSQLDNATIMTTKKNNVITAWKNWEGGVIYELDEVKPLFETFALSKGFNFEIGTLEDFLIQNDDWFNLIFKSDL